MRRHDFWIIVAAGLAAAGCDVKPTGSAPPPTVVAVPAPGESNTTAESAADAGAGATVAEAPQVLTDDKLADGWIALFDGKTLFGWQPHSKADWKVADGAIVVTGGEKGLLCTSVRFSDYVLKADFKAAKGTNSGIFLRTAPVVGKDDITTKCYELNIAPSDNPFPTGSLVGRQKAKEVPDGEDWQSFEVTVDGAKVNVKLNGEDVLSYEDAAPIGRGHIGLQLNEGRVAFKNIKLKPLHLENMFNGKSLAGWKSPPQSKSEFTVTPAGEINVKNGSGCLETEKSYGDFVMQLECISHKPELNSGVFFRCIPGQLMNGYESQIHNGIKNGDRTQPKDAGTGAIFRRTTARLVVSDDGQWFHKTIVADGPHMAVWVNGFQVTDWTDERMPNENPRQGLRTEPGTIQIQGHDPTTDLSFRNLRIAELRD
jgi:3-keto-disaccharide hydrolase